MGKADFVLDLASKIKLIKSIYVNFLEWLILAEMYLFLVLIIQQKITYKWAKNYSSAKWTSEFKFGR